MITVIKNMAEYTEGKIKKAAQIYVCGSESPDCEAAHAQ